MEINHFSHPHHRLILKCAHIPYQCCGCKELGFGSCYQCKHENCNFNLHEECVMAPPTTYHRFFNECDFIFHEKALVGHDGRRCDACGKDLQGFRYQCLHKNHPYEVHPCCVKLKNTFEIGGLKLELSPKVNSMCLHCKSEKISKGIKGWSYVSSCGDYCYHIACMKDIEYEKLKSRYFSRNGDLRGTSSVSPSTMVPNQEEIVPHYRGNLYPVNQIYNQQSTSNPFKLYMEMDHFSHPNHRLILKFAQMPYWCNGCKQEGFGPCYQCKDKNCNFNLHEQCAMASPSAYHPFFPKCDFKFHDKALVGRVTLCDACGKDVLGFRYHCLHENQSYDLHPFCAKLKHATETETNGVKIYLRGKVTSKCLHCKSKEIAKGIKGWSYESSCGKYCYHVACVRDIIYENWKKQFFSGRSDVLVPNQEVGPHSNESSSGNMLGEIAILVLKLGISSYFGPLASDLIIGVLDILRTNG